MPTIQEIRAKLRRGETLTPEDHARPQIAISSQTDPEADFFKDQWAWWNFGNSWRFQMGQRIIQFHCAEVSKELVPLESDDIRATKLGAMICKELGMTKTDADADRGLLGKILTLCDNFLAREHNQKRGNIAVT